MGILSSLRAGIRERTIRLAALTDDEWSMVKAAHPGAAGIVRNLGMEERAREYCALFMGQKQFIAEGGAQREWVLSASFNAVIPFLSLGDSWWRGWKSLYIVPKAFTEKRVDDLQAGVVDEYDDELSGESLELGPVALSWEDIVESGQGRGYNVPVHEMAHKIDLLDGEIDGIPPLSREKKSAFVEARDEAFTSFRRSADGRTGRKRGPLRSRRLAMDEYGAEDEAEFFAVSTESFFDRPLPLARSYPAWYGALLDFYGLDTAGTGGTA
jgi:Mlc titration factor MtfA (ptsG expression regulator)